MEIKHDPVNDLLREGKIDEVNNIIAAGGKPSFSNTDFRSMSLIGLNATGLDFSNTHFLLSDLTDLDLSTCELKGANLKGAKVCGTLFPPEIPAMQIIMSIEHGTRLRY